jgi:OmpA-OmpF porin, OOP family
MKIMNIAPLLAALTLGASLTTLGCGNPPPPPVVAPPPPAPPPPPPPPAPPPPAPNLSLSGAQINVTGDVEFDTGMATIRDSKASQDVLAAVLKILQDNASITKLRVEGHTDSDGNADNNKILSEKRAQAVVAWLVAKGVDARRLHPFGCAALDPLVPNTTAANKQKNRRTELDIEELDGKKPDGYTEPCAPNPAVAHVK